MKLKYLRLGHQAPKLWRVNECNEILLPDNLLYDSRYNFVYDKNVETYKLYSGQACYYTDARFTKDKRDLIQWNNIYFKRRKYISIKAAIRRTLECKGIPKGTLVVFRKGYYYPKKRINNEFLFKIRQENPLGMKYEVSNPSFFNNFTSCSKSKELVDLLRTNGFLVKVSEFEEGDGKKVETAVAYGHKKIVGFSELSKKEPLFDYCWGNDNLLWNKYGEFCKWSKCKPIPKSSSVEDVLNVLLKDELNQYISAVKQERYSELYEDNPTNGITLEQGISQILDEVLDCWGDIAFRNALRMTLILLREVKPTLDYYYPESLLASQIISTLEFCLVNSSISRYEVNNLLSNFPNVIEHYKRLQPGRWGSCQALDEAIDVFHNALRVLNPEEMKDGLMEILDDCFEGYAMFPGSEGRRELFDWWLNEVVPKSLKGG